MAARARSTSVGWIWAGPLMLGLAVALVVVGIIGSMATAPAAAWNGSRKVPAAADEVFFGYAIWAGVAVGVAAMLVVLLQSILWLVRRAAVGQRSR